MVIHLKAGWWSHRKRFPLDRWKLALDAGRTSLLRFRRHAVRAAWVTVLPEPLIFVLRPLLADLTTKPKGSRSRWGLESADDRPCPQQAKEITSGKTDQGVDRRAVGMPDSPISCEGPQAWICPPLAPTSAARRSRQAGFAMAHPAADLKKKKFAPPPRGCAA